MGVGYAESSPERTVCFCCMNSLDLARGFASCAYVSNPESTDNINNVMLMRFSLEPEVGFAGELLHAYPAPVHTFLQ